MTYGSAFTNVALLYEDQQATASADQAQRLLAFAATPRTVALCDSIFPHQCHFEE
jgi:hypothetical protein